jgi:lipopolysaccharide biosynthesis regulator YciM
VDFDLWWLLPIPAVFFALGWVAARIDIKHLLTESRALPLSYFRGLNFLLNEQPGQGDRVVHRGRQGRPADGRPALRARQPVPPAGRDRARDPHAPEPARPPGPARRAARRWRATSSRRTTCAPACSTAPRCCSRSSPARPYETQSLAHLISIYEQEKDWAKAIEVTGRVAEINRTPAFREIAQYHCELAQAAMLRSDPAPRAPEIEQAIAVHRGCARANLGRRRPRDAAGRSGRRARGVAAHRDAEPRVPALVADRVADACRKLGDRPRAIRLLRAWQEQAPSLDLLNALFSLTLETEGADAAAALIKEELSRNPTLLGLDRLLEAQIHAAPPERRRDLELVRNLVNQHIKRLGMYRCEQCGFRAGSTTGAARAARSGRPTRRSAPRRPEGFA